MHRLRVIVRVLVLLVLLAVVGVGAWYYLGQQAPADDRLRASGTIEADAVTLGPQLPGRVVEVKVNEGDRVTAGQPVILLDGATLTAQRDQVQAQVDVANANLAALEQQVASAEANAAAAEANISLLEAGPSAEQLAVARAQVDAAQVALTDLQEAYDELSRAEEDTTAGRELKLRRDTADANYQVALAQQAMTQAGPRQEEIDAARAQADAAHAQAGAMSAQVDAATAQVAAASAALAAAETQLGQLTITSMVDGVVLTRSIEPGEYAAPGAALVVIGRLDPLTITVYVPEDRYGQISVGQQAQVSVDSFIAETFTATVEHIADEAEFTPRNVQTAEGRRSTVFAIRLEIANPDGRLKPGMPADVLF